MKVFMLLRIMIFLSYESSAFYGW